MASIFGGLFVFWGIFMVIMLAGAVLWIVMLVHAIRHDIKDKALWIILILLTGWLGAIIYYFVVKRNFMAGDVPPGTLGMAPKKSNAWIYVLVILTILLAIAGYGMFKSISAIQDLPTYTPEESISESPTPEQYTTAPTPIPGASRTPTRTPVKTPTPTPVPTPIKTWHPVVTFTYQSTGISGYGNTPQFTIRGTTFRMRWTATQGNTSRTMSISTNGVPNSSYGCDFPSVAVAPGSGTLTCPKTGTFYLKLKPNQNVPWSILVEDFY